MLQVTKLTSRARAWSDRVLLTPVLSGLAKPFQLLWAAIVFIGLQIWRWLLRPLWQWVLRPVLWLPLRWAGLQIWRWLLRPLWQWALRPVLWLPLRWAGLQIWRWLLRPLWRWILRPAWSLLRWTGALVLASPWIVARAFPNRGWLASSTVLALTAVVLFVPGVVNAKTRDRLAQVSATAATQSLGTIRPEVSVSLSSFSGWGLEPFDDQHRELVVKQDGAELRILREDHVPNAEDYLRKYAAVKLGVRDRINLYPVPVTVKDSRGKPLRVLQIEQNYHVWNSRNHDLDRNHQALLYDYGTTVLLLVLSTNGQGPELSGPGQKPLWEKWRELQASVRITP
ncbi:MAG: hypothetical protein ACRC20_08905 [Segniliparus sp.]|uniref:hypothetical protein n=1 Tax=Segniliparus sp. TaxID=2804064 RepID=UPI003F3F0DDC